MKNRDKELERLKLRNTKQKINWYDLKRELIASPGMEIKAFKKNPRFSQEAGRLHIEKIAVLLEKIQPGYYYSRDYLVTILEEAGYITERPGTTLNKVFETLYFEGTKTYYIIRKLF